MYHLKPLQPQDVTLFYSWLNDREAIQFSLSLFQKLNTKEEIDIWFKGLLAEKHNLTLGIFLEENNKLIGYSGICSISDQNKSGEYFIFIGDKSLWGRGIGTLITKQIIKIGFENYNLNRIMLTVSEQNTAGIIAYTKAGFKEEGRLRQANFRDGKYHDKIVMSILAEEWKK
jgi:RimJ/RimL family protein N-acetyltransferase